MPTLTFNNYTKYLSEVYQNHNGQMGLFLKLIEEVGEVAEELYKTPNLNKENLGKELADVIHYTLAIASMNNIDIERVIINKDKEASIKYKRQNNLTIFINEM